MAAVTNYHQLDGLKQKFILLQFWRPRTLNQGFHVDRAILPLGTLGKDMFLASSRGLFCIFQFKKSCGEKIMY